MIAMRRISRAGGWRSTQLVQMEAKRRLLLLLDGIRPRMVLSEQSELARPQTGTLKSVLCERLTLRLQ